MTHFLLYSRSWCHLCDDMLQALRALVGEIWRIDVIDVDADPALVERYDELVPVLVGRRPGQEDEQICNYFLNENAVRDFLARPTPAGGILPAESGKMRD